MPIISIETNNNLGAQQQELLLNGALNATSEALSVGKERIDVSIRVLQPGLTIAGGVAGQPFVRYTLTMLAGREQAAKQDLVKRFYDLANEVCSETDNDVKTIIHELQRTDLALGAKLLE